MLATTILCMISLAGAGFLVWCLVELSREGQNRSVTHLVGVYPDGQKLLERTRAVVSIRDARNTATRTVASFALADLAAGNQKILLPMKQVKGRRG